jgi:heme a synthase
MSLVNTEPLLRVMLLGLIVAMGPLAWWWLGRSRAHHPAQRLKRLHALTVLTLFLTFDLILFGAFTRLTDSGLGCPDWPGCYGSASPLGASAHIDVAQNAMPTGPVTQSKAWIEMLHRYLASGVGVLILTLAAHTWWACSRTHEVSPWWATASLFWVCLVGAFGALTVTLKLLPAIVTLHLLGAMALLGLLSQQAALYARAMKTTAIAHIGWRLRMGLLVTFALLWLQIALGGWVSTNYAVLACDTFPTCQSSWWPMMDFASGFELWRELGLTSTGDSISFYALTAIHYTHRLVAYALLLALFGLAFVLRQQAGLQRHARGFAILALWQLLTGLSNVVLGWPLVAALSHTGGAAALVGLFVWTLATSQSTWPWQRPSRSL